MNALLLAALVMAAEPAPPVLTGVPPPVEDAPAADEPPPAVAFRGHLQWITAAGGASSRASQVNPGNRVLQVPAGGAQTELRPDLRLEHGTALSVVARPRFLLKVERAETADGWEPERSQARAEWLEGYATWRVSDRLAVSYGLQNFQWGPAELVSPSNRIFHSTGFYRDPVYVIRGRHLARVNLSAGRQWSVVLLAEVGDNGEAPFVAGEPFEQKAQAKLEYSAPSGDLYAAVTAGAAQRSRAWFGEYAALPILGGLAVYLDAVHSVGRRAWYPVEGPTGPTFEQTGMERRALRTTALGGVRYSFENGWDARLEYLLDEAGWSAAELALAERAALASLAAGDRTGLVRLLDPGFELPGRQLLYGSVLLPDLPPGKRLTVQARYLRSLTDGSGVGFLTASLDATDAASAFLSVSATHGPADGALSRLTRATLAAGATVSW